MSVRLTIEPACGPEAQMIRSARDTLGLIEEEISHNAQEQASLAERLLILNGRRAVINALLEEFADLAEPVSKKETANAVGKIDTSNIPETTEDFFKSAVVQQPKQQSAPKPEGLPSIGKMVIAAVREVGPCDMPTAVSWIAKNYWPGLIFDKAISLHFYSLAGNGRLVRTGTGKASIFRLSDEKKSAPIKRVAVEAPPDPEPAPEPPRLIPRQATTTFKHNGIECDLSPQEWRFVSKLFSAMGKGFLPCSVIVKDVATNGRVDGTPYFFLAGIRDNVNPRLKPLGLMIDAHGQSGFFLREVNP